MSLFSADVLCACGCGLPVRLMSYTCATRGYIAGQPHRFRVGHNMKVGRAIRSYRQRSRPTVKGSGVVYEHVLIAERVLGHPLPSTSEIHHVDGHRDNNTHHNLVICQDRAYHKLLHYRTRIVRAGGNPNTDKICNVCQCCKPLSEFNLRRAHKSAGRQAPCRMCQRLRDRIRHARERAA